MGGGDYLETLGAELSKSVPFRERMDILRYYKGRFEAAGPEGERELMKELGDPRELAQKIIREEGYEDVVDAHGVSQTSGALQAPADGGRRENRRKWPYVALAVAAVAAIAVISTVSRLLWGFVRDRAFGTGASEVTATEFVEVPIDEAASVYAVEEGKAVQVWSDGMAVEFADITVDIPMGNVTIRTGDDFNVSMSGFDGPYRPYYTVEEGRLSMQAWEGTDDDIESLLDSLASFQSVQGSVTVTVPAGRLLGHVEVHTGAGDITLAGTAAEYVNLDTDMGDVSCREMGGTMKLVVETSMGDIELEGGLSQIADLETDMGDIRVETYCTRDECRYEMETDMGEIEIDGRKYGGYAESVGDEAWFELNAETDMGDIRVNFG